MATPTYDIHACARIHAKIKNIAKRKRLTMTQLAAQVQADAELIFDRKYFGRLARGQLGNDLVHAVIKTIAKRYDSKFETELANSYEPIQLTDEGTVPLAAAGYLHWITLTDRERFIFLEGVALPVELSTATDKISAQRATLSFWSGAEMLRLTFHDDLPQSSLLFICSNQSSLPLRGPQSVRALLRRAPIDIGLYNIFDYVQFLFDYALADDVGLVPNLAFLHSKGEEIGRDLVGLAETISENIVPVAKLIDGLYQVDALAIGQHALFRTTVLVSMDGQVDGLDNTWVADLSEASPLGVTTHNYSQAKIIRHRNSKRLRSHLTSQLDLSPVGRLFLKVCELRYVEFVFIEAAEFFVRFNYQQMTLIIGVREDVRQLKEEQIIGIAAKLRIVEAHFAELFKTSSSDSLIEYSTTMHTRNLDSLVWACKFVIEIERKDRKADFEKSVPSDLKKLYEACERGAQSRELIDIYSGK